MVSRDVSFYFLRLCKIDIVVTRILPFLWNRDSAMTEKAQRDIELFLRQAMLNGERVPVIYTDFPFNLMKETGGRAWLAQVIGSVEGPPKTTSIEQGRTLPWAVQFLDCAEGAQELCGARSSEKWNEVCWIDRSDVEIPDKNMINRAPGGQASWHPGKCDKIVDY